MHYVDGEKRYILAPDGLKAGDKVMSGPDAPPTVGNCLPLTKIPLGHGDSQHRDAARSRRRARAARPARAPTLAAREADWAQIILPSGEIRRVPSACRATIGAIGNSDHMSVVLGKAGRKRWMGRRPHVRGTAMNPIDHPHGGGEGRTKGGRHPVSPTASGPRVAGRASVASRRTRRSSAVATRRIACEVTVKLKEL